jgi:histidine triad (HIT) family protein|tara:strand:- start:909 stop:1304 length:396 start_codon:yes stop_codon:yes gene_type:complete
MEKNIFEKIRDGEEKAEIVYKDEYITAFNDIDPNAPVHILIIPNKSIVSLNEIQEEDSIYLSNILLGANKIAKQMKIDESGYRLITNCGSDGGQEVPYLHFHLVGGLKLGKMISLSKSEKKRFNELKLLKM